MSGIQRTVPWSWRASSVPEVRQIATRWLASPALRTLTAAFGGPAPDRTEPSALAAWSAEVLDTRRGAERREARPATWTPNQVEALLAAAGALGLLGTAAPSRPSYRATVILGGASTGNRLRTALARQLTDQVDLGQLVAVAAERPLGDHEIASEPDSAEDRTEWANLLRILGNVFGPLRPAAASDGGTGSTAWQDREFTTAAGRPLRLLVAPPSGSGRRADTADGLRFLLERLPLALRRETLLITSAIYAPYQFFAGAPVALSDGAELVELVGTRTAADGEPTRLAQRVAQEIHAATQAAAVLHG